MRRLVLLVLGGALACSTVHAPQPVAPRQVSAVYTASLSGFVAVAPKTLLHPTAAAAVATASIAPVSRVQVYQVVGEVDGAVRVRTGFAEGDCAASQGAQPAYEVEGFVSREALVARLREPVLIEHPDGTGVVAWVGTPVRLFDDGHAEAIDERLAKALGPIPTAKVALATTAGSSVAWTAPAVALACDPLPEPVADWHARRRSSRSLARSQQADQIASDRMARCLEKRAREPAPKKPPTNLFESLSAAVSCETAAAIGGFAAESMMDTSFAYAELPSSQAHVPACSVADEGWPKRFALLGGRDFQDLERLAHAEPEPTVHRVQATWVARVSLSCGELRLSVPADAVGRAGRGGLGTGGLGGKSRPILVAPAGSALTWQDGTPAGKTLRAVGYPTESVTQSGERACVRIHPFATPLCYAISDLKASTDRGR